MDNQTISFWNESDNSPPLHTRLAFASAWIIIAVAGILGNGLVIYVAVRFQKMSNVTNCYIVNLAITDIVFLAFCMPLLVVQYTLEQWLFNQIICKLLNFISFVSVLVTVLTLVVMTIDRYIYVVRPFANLKWRKPRTVLLLSIIIWLVSCILASPYYHHYGLIAYSNSHVQCALLSDEEMQKYFRIYTVTLYYFIPLIIIIIAYTSLLYFIYSKENKLRQNMKTNVVRRSKKRRAVTKMVAIVTFAFALCWLPITLYIMLGNLFEHKTALLYYFKIIAHSLAYLNSSINPILYAFLNRSFRNNCGSLIFEPSCSVFCGNDYRRAHHHRHHNNYPQNLRPPSTQIDRFSYQSTNCQTASSNIEKKQYLMSISDDKNRLSVDIPSYNDYSDGEYELFEADSNSHIPLENTTTSKYVPIIKADTLTTTF